MSSFALQSIIYGMALCTAMGCSKVTVSKVAGQTGRLEGSPKTSTPSTDKADEEVSADAEKVVPPSNISGTSLVCEVTRDPAANQAAAVCALREDSTQKKVDMATFRSYEWQADVPTLNSVTSTVREMPVVSNWHLEIQIKAGTAMQLEFALEGVRVSLQVRNPNGKSETMSKPIMTATDNPQWLALNGEMVPPQAIIAGTEYMGKTNLSICRIYARGGVYPGKMEPHYKNSDKSMCYSTRDGLTIQSMSEDARTVTNNSDVLMPGARPWNELVEWIAMTPISMQIPKNAFVGGMDDRGEALYVCRGSEVGPPSDPNDLPNDPAGEWTPGYVKASTGYCQHEYYGQRVNPSYQLLVWKTAP